MSDEKSALLARALQLIFQRAFFSAAHAIGTPLNVISGHAELLQHRSPTDARAGVQKIVAECGNISALLLEPLQALPTTSGGEPAELDSLIASALELISDATRARVTIETGNAAKHKLPRLDGVLALWALAELGAL